MLVEDGINYSRIAQAQAFYRALGYPCVDVPWLVSPGAITATLPPDTEIFSVVKKRPEASPFDAKVHGCLLGSGEQGFIQLMLNGQMEPGKYQTTTPCFRDEKQYNELTRLSFFKTELIWYMPEDQRFALETVLNNAIRCFFEVSHIDTFEATQTPEGMDIYFNGIELGSYGVRQMGDHVWVYGTGLAEPRFSIALKRLQQVAHAISMTVESGGGGGSSEA